MNDRDGVRVGRPYGGLGILWRKSLGQSCNVKPLGDPRLLMLELSLDGNKHMTLLNVYLPCDDGSNLEDYQMYLAKVSSYLDGRPIYITLEHLVILMVILSLGNTDLVINCSDFVKVNH